MFDFKILWVDDDTDVLDSARRLLRNSKWQLDTAIDAKEAQALLSSNDTDYAVDHRIVIADQRLPDSTGVEFLSKVYEKSPAVTRMLVTGSPEVSVMEGAVNAAHVFRFVQKPWEPKNLLRDIEKAVEQHRLKITQTALLKEVKLQNRQLERLTSGLEQIVAERTADEENSKLEIEEKLSKVRDLVRFIKDLSTLSSVEELLGLVRKELKKFHELRAPMLGYVVAERTPVIQFFQGKQVVEREARQMWSVRSRMRASDHEDRLYLANEFGRPFAKVLAVPLKRRAIAPTGSDEAPATLFFEHALPDDRVDAFIGFISERLQPLSIALDRIILEYHLKATSLQWEGTFDGIKDPIALIDIDYQVIRSNRNFTKSAQGARTIESVCHRVFAQSDVICRGCPLGEALQTGLPQKAQIKRGDLTYEVRSYPIRLGDDTASTTVINHYVDVTAARVLHGRMIQSEKMAAVGLLAGNIAHELNNPLTGIRSLAQVLLAEVPETGTLKADIDEVERAAARSQKIIENLLDFSKGDTEQKQSLVSLNEVVSRTLPMLKTAMRDHRNEVRLIESEAKVRVEPHLMQQVVFNLVNNACQAMQDPGSILIETEIVKDPDGKNWFALNVIDTGPGIPAEIIETIFEPFFTTKEIGEGTGLGLSMSRSIVENFGGVISVETKLGEGSRFTVRLPI
ncbi:MAG: ATP-binding protein [Bdellovibrionota bacterium]